MTPPYINSTDAILNDLFPKYFKAYSELCGSKIREKTIFMICFNDSKFMFYKAHNKLVIIP